MARLVSFDTESAKSNLPLVSDVEAYLRAHGVDYVRVPNETGDKAASCPATGCGGDATRDRAFRTHLKSLSRDVLSLTDHATYLGNNITFLLDASMGMINIEQNAIIKIFSVAAVVFLPPTLVASIYGMNFRHMPELDWPLGYPLALLLMVLSAALPFLFFRRKGWL